MFARLGSALGAVPTLTTWPNVGFTVIVSPYVVCARPRMLPWLKRLKTSTRSTIARPECLMRPSANSATSEVGVPRNADLLIALQSITGRSLFAPSPLLSMPVTALNGRDDANWLTVPAVMLYGRL